MPPPSTEELAISNYDVLADEISNPRTGNESDVGLSLAAHSYHVGNNRLEVLCNIYNHAFTDSQEKGDEVSSAAIVEKIMGIVQDQCVPKGRFLERRMKGEWSVVETGKARLLVRQALGNVQNQSRSTVARGGGQQSAEALQKKQEDDAEKKRRRRSSLLRRSVSSSMLPNFKERDPGKEIESNTVDKKKSSRKGSIVKSEDSSDNDDKSRSTSRSSSPSSIAKSADPAVDNRPRPVFGRSRSVEVGGTGRSQRRFATTFERPPIIKDTLKMDVLMNTAKTALVPGTDLHGNNRLRVMVNIQTTAYTSADPDTKLKMANDLLGTIENFWGGRILSQIPSLRRKGEDDQYVKLDKANSIMALKNLLSGKAAQREEEATQGEETDSHIQQGRRASLNAIQKIATTADPDASILPSTLPTLPPDMQHLRNAAVKSLQKRKQRQGLNSRIRGLTADKAAAFQDGSAGASSNASVMTSRTAMSTSHNITPPIPTTISGSGGLDRPSVLTSHYRQTSSGASVASSVTHQSQSYNPPPGSAQRQGSISAMSISSYNPPPGLAQRQGSISAMSTSSSMSMNTMNAARTMANINLNNPNLSPVGSSDNRFVHHPGNAMLGSELHIPTNIIAPMGPMGMNPNQFHQHGGGMPAVPEEMYPAMGGYPQQSSFPINHYNNQFQQNNNQDYQNYGTGFMDGGHQHHQQQPDRLFDNEGEVRQARNSLLNSTGSDGLPKFEQGEMDLLIKGLEMGENQQQQPDHDA